MVESFVNAVYVYEDRLVITINVREQTETVTFEEAKSLFSFAMDESVESYERRTDYLAVGDAVGFIIPIN